MVNKLEDDLYLGDLQDALHADEYAVSFDRVITIGHDEETPHTTEGDHFPFPDGGWTFDIDEHYPIFKRAVNTVRDAMASDACVLVHCRAGQSRSVMAVTAALAVRDGESFDSTWWGMRSKVPNAQPQPALKYCATRYINRSKYGGGE